MKRFKEFGLLTMALLVLLRLAIGWHFFYEGFHKLDSFARGETTTNKPFSSAGYFREAPGPLAWDIRQVVGDPDDEALARLTVLPPPQDPLSAKPYLRTPPGLQKDWEYVLKQHDDAYSFEDKQRELARLKLEQNEDAVVQWLTMAWDPALKRQAPDDEDDLKKIEKQGFKAVEKTSPAGGTGTVKILETPAERIDEYRNKVQEYRAMLDQTDATFGADVVGANRLAAKTDAAALRKSLQEDLDRKTADFKASLDSLLTPEQLQKHVVFWGSTPLLWWIDGITAWALAIIGGCLLLGLLTRTNCVLAAGFLLMTYFIAPPWPWLPTPPNVEGNYLFVNKNVVEMFALMALATTASGRWFGVDALLHWMFRAMFGRKAPVAAQARKAA
jgi:uncharacterized membrane protein YphA (DoxX/SURF4 family)